MRGTAGILAAHVTNNAHIHILSRDKADIDVILAADLTYYKDNIPVRTFMSYKKVIKA